MTTGDMPERFTKMLNEMAAQEYRFVYGIKLNDLNYLMIFERA
jgi:hypothetical protein